MASTEFNYFAIDQTSSRIQKNYIVKSQSLHVLHAAVKAHSAVSILTNNSFVMRRHIRINAPSQRLHNMTIPILTLLGFALWTLLILFGTVGIYRWSRILSGRTKISHWTADPDVGSGIYPRAMRAHMNCIENLPVFGAIVLAIDHVGLDNALVNTLAITVLVARIVQSLVHITLTQTDRVIFVRFAFYFFQIIAMIVMAVMVLLAL
jgi:uncharacterized MAPEG superfamily protein